MHNRIIRISAALAGCILLATGCIRTGALDTDGEAIRFTAESMLLRNDATKAGDIKEGESFDINDAFSVFGRRYTSGGTSLVFDGTTVTNKSTGWEYSPLVSWDWESSGNYYDFVAVFPAGKGTERMSIEGNLSVQTDYELEREPTPDNYDLMAATYRRKGSISNPNARVDFSFIHMTSAVGVVIVNQSESTDVSISGIRFKNMVVCGTAKVTLDNLGATLPSWINTERNTNEVRATTYDPMVVVEAGKRYARDEQHPDIAKDYDLMIPQRLDQAADGVDKFPTLLLTYQVGGSTKEVPIVLKNVPQADSTPITTWEMGCKYTYIISMRLDGGLLVSITTTVWESVEAETPGILI